LLLLLLSPQFTLPVLTDPSRTFRSADLKGRWYVFNVWGTWCGGCREEHSALLEIRKITQVPLIGLDWKDEDPQALQWLTQLGNPYEVEFVTIKSIVEKLRAAGIDIARRTVAKYREAMRIPSSVQRRRDKLAVAT